LILGVVSFSPTLIKFTLKDFFGCALWSRRPCFLYSPSFAWSVFLYIVYYIIFVGKYVTGRKKRFQPHKVYVYFMVSETLPSACYIRSDESSIAFYYTSNGYKNLNWSHNSQFEEMCSSVSNMRINILTMSNRITRKGVSNSHNKF